MRDIDLALLGLLPDGQLLGGPVASGTLGPSAATEKLQVALDLPPDSAMAARASGGLILRDEEHTPLARLDLERHAADLGPRVRGQPSRVRSRESGVGREHAVTSTDLWPLEQRTVVVFARPPVASDAPAISSAATEDPARPLVAVVSDDDHGELPTPILLEIVQAWLSELDLGIQATVRIAPLAWRDPASDAALAGRLGRSLGAIDPLFVGAEDGSPGAATWRGARRALERATGDPTVPEGTFSPAVLTLLHRWRPPRSTRGLVLMLTGLSGSGKSTIARDVRDWIRDNTERTVSLLDGDVVRTMLSSGLGFSREDRELNVRRIGYVAAEIARHGGIAICAPIAPYAATREAVRGMACRVGDFVLVHVSTPLEACETRDLKGLYAKARAGAIAEFTGISDPYEAPIDADLAVDTSVLSRDAALDAVVSLLRTGGWITVD